MSDPGEERPAGARLREIRQEEQGVVLVVTQGDAVQTYTVAPDAVPSGLPPAGGEIDAPLLTEIRHAALRKQAARRIFALLDRRLRSRADLERRLTAEGFEREHVVEVLDAFAAAGLHSDHDFAAAFCRDTLRRQEVGRIWLLSRLRGQGVPAGIAEQTVAAELPPAHERALALAAARRRWGREPAGDPRRAEARVMRFLASRGFPAALCREAGRAAGPGRAAAGDLDPREDDR
ncbi:MAG: regulatory protein RecX [Candidatus Krumholzibacteriia bacterium]